VSKAHKPQVLVPASHFEAATV